jgi:hypothetical protein
MGLAIKVGIVIVVLVAIYFFTNIFELARPGVEKSLNSTKEAASKVQGKEVVSEVENLSSSIHNITSQIKIKNP